VDVNGPEAWAVGEGGVIFHSMDYGESWMPVNRAGKLDARQLKPWNAIQYLSEKRILVAGDGGVVRQSMDAGFSFSPLFTGVGNALLALAAPGQRNAGDGVDSPNPGIAVGGGRTILAYSPTANTWTPRGGIPKVNYYGVSMLPLADGVHAWVVGDNGVIVANAASNPLWNTQASATGSALRAVHAVANGTGVRVTAVGDAGTIVQSDDGVTWVLSTSVPRVYATRNLHGVYFRSPTMGFVVGDAGLVLRTLDGGKSWNAMQVPTESNLYAVSALPNGAGDDVYAVGEHQTVLRSVDGGTSWTRLPAPVPAAPGMAAPDFTYRAVQVTAPDRAAIAGDAGHRLITGNGGETWSETDGQSGRVYTALRLISPGEGFSVGNGTSGPAVSFTSTAWKYESPAALPSSPELYAGDTVGHDAIVVGADGTILRSSDALSSAGSSFGPESADVRAVVSPLPGVYVAAGGGALALYSLDDGATWKNAKFTSNPFGRNVEFRALGFNAPDGSGNAVGYLAGGVPGQSAAVLFQSDDSGRTWTPVPLDLGSDEAPITALAVFSSSVVAAAANGAVFIESGNVWHAERPIPNFAGPWLAVSANDARWYVVGVRGRAARFPDGAGQLAWQALNTGTILDIASISGPPSAGFAMAAPDASGSGESLRDDIRGVCMRPEGILLTDSGGLALFGDLDQDTFISMKDAAGSAQSIGGQSVPDDDAYFFGDIFPPVPAADILPGDGIVDMRDTVRVTRKTQGLD
jgi:photosystem II stability/assembly factor-like uncharacterized protein